MPLVPAKLPTVKRAAPTWYERTIVFRLAAQQIHAEDAMTYGTLAVHATLPEQPGSNAPITVTHVPSMLAVVRVDTIEDATRLVERLWDTSAAVFGPDQVDVAKIPANVLEWITRCGVERKLVAMAFPTFKE